MSTQTRGGNLVRNFSASQWIHEVPMSASWSLYSFFPDRLASIFGGGNKGHADALYGVLADKSNFDFEDLEVVERISCQVVAKHFSYDGADEDDTS